MNIYDIIEKKKNKIELNKEEIDFFIKGYTNGEIPDYQISALLMAICINGMTDEEIYYLTMAMVESGETIDLSQIQGITVDKHSTGGVGDKTTLIVMPIVASLGGKVAKMSGRGLGHTGGTIDKLEAIEGFKVQLEREQFINQVNTIGASLISQSGNLTPADKKIYALRDVTATVDSIPLIASSVMSKKIAAGSKAILLDVKMGSGAFMKTQEEARKLAEKMVRIGTQAGRKTIALITNMDIPLGNAIGNELEVKEAIDVLKGKGPEDLKELCIELATYMIMMCNGKDKNECRKMVEESIDTGTAYRKLKEIVEAQGGKLESIESSKEDIEKLAIYAPQSGYIVHMDTEEIGKISTKLGAGRQTKEDTINYKAGIILKAKAGDYVKVGDEIAEFYTSDIIKAKQEEPKYIEALTFSQEPVKDIKLIYDVVE